MQPLLIEEVPYAQDSATLFSQLLDLEAPILLDSAAPYSSRGRYDVLTAQPATKLIVSDAATDDTDYFLTVSEKLAEYTPCSANDYHLPFIGGAAGYFGYDLGRQTESLTTDLSKDTEASDAITGIYTWAIIVDHRQQRSVLVAQPNVNEALLKDIRHRIKTSAKTLEKFTLTTPFTSNFSRTEYEHAFQQIKQYLLAGDCYQVNLAQRFTAQFEGSPWAAYLLLRQVAAAPFSAYIGIDKGAVLSLSPERFIHAGNGRVVTSPIKGTTKRDDNPEQDAKLAATLLSSKKDRAENLMIVDLLRNDLGKSCVPGSIQVDELFELQSFETVHHLVSTISGQLKTDTNVLQLLSRCFPGGSITGAPKKRAMEIIEELEPNRRSVYCGSIGYVSSDGQMDTSIAIRTLLCDGGDIHCWAGGGIVADSECESEYQECLAKVGKLLEALTA